MALTERPESLTIGIKLIPGIPEELLPGVTSGKLQLQEEGHGAVEVIVLFVRLASF